MNLQEISKAYDFTGKTIAITGGGGVLCGEMARCLAGCNANIVILDRDMSLGEKVVDTLKGTKGKHKAIFIDVLDKTKVQEAANKTYAEYGKVDILINGAGGNNPKATTSAEMSFFDIPSEAIQFVANLNLLGAIIPSQVFGKAMVAQKEGIILNISSIMLLGFLITADVTMLASGVTNSNDPMEAGAASHAATPWRSDANVRVA
jgi:NAD(P)-dependent dehydrogenase (short-subunit alcohol dehydrogenase family)